MSSDERDGFSPHRASHDAEHDGEAEEEMPPTPASDDDDSEHDPEVDDLDAAGGDRADDDSDASNHSKHNAESRNGDTTPARAHAHGGDEGNVDAENPDIDAGSGGLVGTADRKRHTAQAHAKTESLSDDEGDELGDAKSRPTGDNDEDSNDSGAPAGKETLDIFGEERVDYDEDDAPARGRDRSRHVSLDDDDDDNEDDDDDDDDIDEQPARPAAPSPASSAREAFYRMAADEREVPRLTDVKRRGRALVKLPNLLEFKAQPFDPQTFDETDEHTNHVDELTLQERVRVKGATARWRFLNGWSMDRLAAAGADVLKDPRRFAESNANLVRWSDGSCTLHVGSEAFDVVERDASQDTNAYVFRRHPQLQVSEGHVDSKWLLRPATTEGIGHRRLATLASERTANKARSLVVEENYAAPELEEKRAENSRLQLQRMHQRREKERLRRAEKLMLSTIEKHRGLSVDFIEGRSSSRHDRSDDPDADDSEDEEDYEVDADRRSRGERAAARSFRQIEESDGDEELDGDDEDVDEENDSQQDEEDARRDQKGSLKRPRHENADGDMDDDEDDDDDGDRGAKLMSIKRGSSASAASSKRSLARHVINDDEEDL